MAYPFLRSLRDGGDETRVGLLDLAPALDGHERRMSHQSRADDCLRFDDTGVHTLSFAAMDHRAPGPMTSAPSTKF
jgi:hypothetical protein